MDAASEKTLARIIRSTRVAALGTLHGGEPLVSMITFVAASDFTAFYTLVSKLAQHTIDMEKESRVSLMIREKDDDRDNPQMLARISIRGKAELFPQGEPGYAQAKRLYLKKFPLSESLFELKDFGMWKITPKGGRYVAGLAKAFNLTPDALKKVSNL